MKSKPIKRLKKETETIASLKKQIITLQNSIVAKNDKILKLQQKVLDSQTKNGKTKMKNIPILKSKVTQPFEVTLKGLNDKHDIIYSSKK